MSARVERRVKRDGAQGYAPRCDGCGKNATRRELLLGYVSGCLCNACAKASRAVWESALLPSTRCNGCESGRLLRGAPGGLVDLWTCVDCGRQVPASAMTMAEAA